MTEYINGPDTKNAIWFRENLGPRPMADCAVADVNPIDPAGFAGGAVPSTQWRAKACESWDGFRQRILADLATAGTRGVVVSLVWRPGFWNRNVSNTGLLAPG